MAKFMDRYGTGEKREAALIASRWPMGIVCPACCGQVRSAFRRERRLYWQCAKCPYQCGLTSDTIFHRSRLPLAS